MSLLRQVFILLLALGALGVLFSTQQKTQLLKLRVAHELLGWDGLFETARETMALRLLGARQTASRTAYHDFLAMLARVDLEYCVPTRRVVDETDIAECHRFATHLVRSALKLCFEADLEHPHLEPFVEPRVKVLGDNPDAFYYGATFMGGEEYDYEVVGRREPGEVYTSLTIYEQQCVGCFVGRVLAEINHRALRLDEEGRFHVLITSSAERAAKYQWNVMNVASLARGHFPQLISRHYFENDLPAQMNKSIHVDISLRRVNEVAAAKQQHVLSTDQRSARQLEYATNFVRAHSLEMLQDPSKAPSWFSFSPNKFGKPVNFAKESVGAGAVDIVYSAGPFKFTDVERQGLLITGVMPPCEFANIALWNRLLQTFAYEQNRPVSLNRKQLKLDLNARGQRYTILLSKRMPKQGLPAHVHWLDSEGRRDGQMFWRFLLVPEDEQVETPSAQLVEDIDAHVF